MSPYLIKQVLKAHVGVDAQLHDVLTSKLKLREYLYALVAISRYLLGMCGPCSVVGIATGFGLDSPKIESRWGEIFRTCPDRPWVPTNLLYNRYRDFPGGKGRPGRDTYPSPPPNTVVKKG
jgi:hypothetical protein